MISTADAKYIISEIRNIPYYDEKVKECTDRLEELEQELLSSSGPFSPNGGTDVRIGSKVVRIRIPGHGESSAEKITRIGMMKDDVEIKLREFKRLRQRARMYYNTLLADEQWHEFVAAFFGNEQYDSLSINYAIGNPYRQMVSIIRNNIRRV